MINEAQIVEALREHPASSARDLLVYMDQWGHYQEAVAILNDLEARRVIISVGTAGPTNHPHWWGKRWSVAPEAPTQHTDEIPHL